MPDLRNSPIVGSNGVTFGTNYARAEQKFSNFGTRRLRFYTIEIAGYNAYTEPSSEENTWNYETTGINGDDGFYGYRNPPGSIIEAILRGVSLVAEIYYVSWYHVEILSDTPHTFITVAVAGDTFLDGVNQYLQTNQNAYSMQGAIADALGDNFNWDSVFVYAQEIQGRTLEYNSDGPPVALNRTPTVMSEADQAARSARISSPKGAGISRNR